MSLGVQSFDARDLKFMNRAHNAEQAHQALIWVARQFDNYSVDLIYGIPEQDEDSWRNNLSIVQEINPPRLSCYALTREPGTAMDHFMHKGVMSEIDEDQAQREHQYLTNWAQEQGYVNYEFSNFALPGFKSVNNSAYWQGLPYLGIGPSAHSFDGTTRSWNIANNPLYAKAIEEGRLPITRESLTPIDRYNEYVMTQLRTDSGINLNKVADLFDVKTRENLLKMAARHIDRGLLVFDQEHLRVSAQGKFLTDGIASDLFLVNLGS